MPLLRGVPPEAPRGLAEDELGLRGRRSHPWTPPGAREWLRAKACRFDPAQCYHAGANVSDNPLGSILGQLPRSHR